MALIVCPECGGKVSDKANACIHCGYPMSQLAEMAKYKIILKDGGPNKVKVIGLISNVTGEGLLESKELYNSIPCNIATSLSKQDADNVIAAFKRIGAIATKEIDEIPDKNLETNDFIKKLRVIESAVTCPKCCSTQIAFIPRGIEGTLHDFNRCQKCGYRWPVTKH